MASVNLKLRPVAGRQVRKEDGSLMPVDGCDVPNTTYYRRRLSDGDLEQITVSKPVKAAKGEK